MAIKLLLCPAEQSNVMNKKNTLIDVADDLRPNIFLARGGGGASPVIGCSRINDGHSGQRNFG